MRDLTACLLLAAMMAGCSGETSPAASASPTAEATAVPTGRVYQTTLDDFPDWVPLPEDFVVLMDGGAGGARSAVLEVGGDLPALVDRLNAELASSGLGAITPIEQDGDRYMARGVISQGLSTATISVAAYDEGGAMKPGNTGSVSYTIGG